MNSVPNFVVTGAAALLLLGAGCNTQPTVTTQPESKPAGEVPAVSTTTPVSVENPTTPPATELVLSAESKDNMVVHLSFTAPAEMMTDVQGFRLLMGREANPTAQTATDWYNLGPAHRSKDWTVRTKGVRHFRVCVLKKNQCDTFSNDVELEVK